MAISFVGASAYVSGIGTFVPNIVSVATPAGYQAGDLLVVVGNLSGASGLPIATGYAPSGWFSMFPTATNQLSMIWYKIASASEPGVALFLTEGMTAGAAMFCYRGAQLDVVGTYQLSLAVSSIATASVTTRAANDYVVSVYGAQINARTWTAPGSTTTRLTANPTAFDGGILVVDELQATEGASATRTASVTGGGTTLTRMSFALKETEVITYIGSGGNVNGANPTVTAPTGLVNGDLLMIVTTGSATPTTPTGWTQYYAQGAGQFLTILTRYVTGGSQGSVALTLTGATSRSVMLGWRNASLLDTRSTVATGTGTTATTGTFTTNFANSVVVSIYTSASTATNTWTTPTSTTSRVNNASSSGANVGRLIVSELQATAGTTTARSTTLSVSNTWSALAVAMVPKRTLYWVGGTASWDSTAGTKWALTSGGTGGAAVPTPGDNVVFDASSGAGVTVTIAATAVACFDFTANGFSSTITGTSALIVNGSWFSQNTLFGYTGTVTFAGGGGYGQTINIPDSGTGSSGLDINSVTIDTGGNTVGQVALLSSMGIVSTTARTLTLTSGVFNLGSNNCLFAIFNSNNSNSRSLVTDPAFAGTIQVHGRNTNVITMATSTNLIYSGRVFFYSTIDGGTFPYTGTRSMFMGTTSTATTAPNLTVEHAGDTVSISNNVNNLTFAVAGAPLAVTTVANNVLTIFGSVQGSGAYGYYTFTGGANTCTFAGVGGTYDVEFPADGVNTGSNIFLDFPVTFNGTGSTWNMLNTWSNPATSNTRVLTLTAGTLYLQRTMYIGSFSSSGTATRSIGLPAPNTSNLYLTAVGTVTLWNTGTNTNFSVQGILIVFDNGLATTGTRTITTGLLAESNQLDFILSSAGTGTTLAFTSTFACGGLDLSGFTGTVTNTTKTIYAYLVSGTGTWQAGTSVLTFASTDATQTWQIDASGITLDFPITFNGVGGSWYLLNSPLVTGATRTVTLTAGDLYLYDINTLTPFFITCGVFSSSNSNSRSLRFGTGGAINITGTSGTVWSAGTLTNFSYTGNSIVYVDNSSTGVTFTHGPGTEAQAINVYVNGGSGNFNGDGSSFLDLTLDTPYTGQAPYNWVAYGNVTQSPNSSSPTPGPTFGATFAKSSGTQTYISQGIPASRTVTKSGGGTLLLGDSLNLIGPNGTFTLSAGDLNLDTFSLTCVTFTTSTGVRSLTFGTGSYIEITGNNATVFSNPSTGTFNLTGTSDIRLTYSGNTGSRTISSLFTLGAYLNFSITAGQDTIVTPTSFVARNLDFTGFSGAWQPSTSTIYGNLTLNPTMAVTTAGTTITFQGFFAGPTLTTVDTAGVTLDVLLTFNTTVTRTWQLLSNIITGSTRTVTLTQGTLDLNSKTISCGIFATSGTATREIAFGSSGAIYLTGNNTTIWSAATNTGLTTTGSRNVITTYAGGVGSRTFSNGVTAGAAITNYINLAIVAGTDSVTVSGAIGNLNFTGFNGTLALGTRTIYGDLIMSAGMTVTAATQATTFGGNTGGQIISAGKNLDFPITFGATATDTGVWRLMDNLAVGTATARTVTLTAGTLDLNNNTVTLFGTFSSSNTNTRAINFGSTGAFYLTGFAATGSFGCWTTQVATGLTITGTYPAVYVTGTDTFGAGRGVTASVTSGSQTNTFNLFVTSGAGSIEMGGGTSQFRDVDFTGFSGNITNAGRSGGSTFTSYGNVTMSASMTENPTAGTITFAGTTPYNYITTNGFVFDRNLTFNAPGGTYILNDNITISAANATPRAVTVTAGTVNLNNRTITCGTFVTSGSSTRTIDWGTSGNIVVTGSGTTVVNIGTTTGLTVLGEAQIYSTYSGNVGTRTFLGGSGATEDQAISVYITGGTDTLTVTANRSFKTLSFGSWAGTLTAETGNRLIYGSLIFSPGLVLAELSGGGWSMLATRGSWIVDGQGSSIRPGSNFTFSGSGGVGATWQLVSDLAIGPPNTLGLTSGTVVMNGYRIFAGVFNTNTTNTRSIQFGTGKIVLDGNNGTILNAAQMTNMTTSGSRLIELNYSGGTGTRTIDPGFTGVTELNALSVSVTAGTDIVTTAAGSRIYRDLNFTGFSGSYTLFGEFFYGNVTYSSAMTLTGNTTVALSMISTTAPQTFTSNGQTIGSSINVNATNGNVRFTDALTQTSTRNFTHGGTATVIFTAGTTNTVGNYVTSGTGLKYLKSSVGGTRATLNQASGTVTATYLSIQDSAATGGATFTATDSTNVNGGNNTGWNFGITTQTYRLNNSGLMQTAPVELFEVGQTRYNMTKETLYATEFDENTTISPAMTLTNGGNVRVKNEFTETTVVFASDGSSLTGWTNLGITVDSTLGNPGPSYRSTGSTQYAYIVPGGITTLLGKTIQLNMRATGANPLIGIYFGCNVTGAGQIFRLDCRAGNPSGFAACASWTSWSAPSSGPTLTVNTWYQIRIEITTGGTMSYFVDGSLVALGSFVNNGPYFGLQGDAGSGGNWDNIVIFDGNGIPG